MRVQIPGLGMYQYLLPVLAAWAARMGYDLPDTSDDNLTCYYSTEMDDDVRGNHLYWKGNTTICIRPTISKQLSTWAHEFAHMIQSVNLGRQWRRSYDASSEDNGYYDNVFEIEARECSIMATIFESMGWLLWEVDYNLEGEYSTWPRPKPAKSAGWGMSCEAYYENRYYDIVPWYDSDYFLHWLPCRQLLEIKVKRILRLFTGYLDISSILNMQQYNM